jgi:hypothetical protein
VRYPAVYVILTRGQEAQAEMYAGVPAEAFAEMEAALLTTGRFVVAYHNVDADILVYVHPPAQMHTAHLRALRGIS